MNKLRPLEDPVDIHGVPPHSVEAEQGVLGSMILSRAAISECMERLARVEELREILPSGETRTRKIITSDFFFVPHHKTIFSVLCELYEKGSAVDLITFTQELRDRNLLEAVGGAGYVTSLFTFVPTAANVENYLDIVRDKFVLRETIATCTEAVRRAYEEQDEVQPLLDEVQGKITAVALNKLEQSPLRQINDDVGQVLDELENAHLHRGRT